jgi:hypothetical protein
LGAVVALVLLGIAAVVGGIIAYEALSGARDDANKNFSNACVGSPATPCATAKMTPISPSKADDLFKKMAAQSDRIPFDYPVDCCSARAQEMCRMMKDDGVDCGKVWNYENPGPPPGPALIVDTPNVPGGKVAWVYHVAPIVDVQGDDGVVRTMVIDPSIFDHPVTVDEWRAAQHAPNSITQYTEHFDPSSSPSYRDINGAGRVYYDPDCSQANEKFQQHQVSRDSQDSAFTAKLAEKRHERVMENSN